MIKKQKKTGDTIINRIRVNVPKKTQKFQNVLKQSKQ